jgi:hypothetical protein
LIRFPGRAKGSRERLPASAFFTEIALGFRRGEKHAVFGHAQPVQGGKRLASGEPGRRWCGSVRYFAL